jgi:23S rRNA (adenine2503-C2)-methyltransferase
MMFHLKCSLKTISTNCPYSQLRRWLRAHSTQCSTDNNTTNVSATAAVPINLTTKRLGSLLAYPLPELREILTEHKIDAYIANQIYYWIYKRNVKDFNHFSNISKINQAKLEELFHLRPPTILKHSISSVDHTHKWLLGYNPKDSIETVYIPMQESKEINSSGQTIMSGGLCVSSQTACSLSCAFCATGAMSKANLRNLSTDEIINQILTAKQSLGDFSLAPIKPKDFSNKISSLIFMGMGEPMYNYRNVEKSLRILTDESGLGFGKNRITLSTSGVAPGIEKLRKSELGVKLAISLHASNNDLRDELVPINKQFPLEVLLAECYKYQQQFNQRITFEYTLLDGVNNSHNDAKQLVNLLKQFKLQGLINLIPFSPYPGAKFTTPSNNSIYKFSSWVGDEFNYPATIRWSKGLDIAAACGQLSAQHQHNVYDVNLKQSQRIGVKQSALG